jgi:hypothetical protein
MAPFSMTRARLFSRSALSTVSCSRHLGSVPLISRYLGPLVSVGPYTVPSGGSRQADRWQSTNGRWRLAARRGGVDRLLQAAEPDAALGKPGDGVDQVAQRPPSRSSFHTSRVSPGGLVKDLLDSLAASIVVYSDARQRPAGARLAPGSGRRPRARGLRRPPRAGNVSWTTRAEQDRNRRRSLRATR